MCVQLATWIQLDFPRTWAEFSSLLDDHWVSSVFKNSNFLELELKSRGWVNVALPGITKIEF